ncbi:FoF1 ATP synthase subunit a [Nonomuraea sp. NPDC059194]|uniref:FoF1 ATP synthase subunit A n=1 Tax=Nonomuraea sp. NPDC059194 TaxID=3346764 RepID=UPI00369CCFFE
MSDRFNPPGPELFELPPLFRDGPAWLTKPVLIAVLTALLLIAFFWAAFAKPRLVPRGMQNLGELGYVFVRDQVARPFLGRHTDRWMGLLLTVFFTTLVWNVMGVIPLVQYPIAANVAFHMVLAVTVYVIKIYQAVKHHGWSGYLSPLGSIVGLVGVVMTILVTAFELFIMFLQAYLFTLLAAMFIGDAIEGNH